MLPNDAKPEDEEEKWKVSNCELFFDLVYVVIIHVVSLPLEEDHGHPNHGDTATKWALVFLMTLTVWFLWSSVSDFAVTARLFEDLKGLDQGVVLTAMVGSGLMARCSTLGNTNRNSSGNGEESEAGEYAHLPVFVFWYLAVMALVAVSYAFVVKTKPGPTLSDKDRKNLSEGMYLYPIIWCLDAATVLPAAFLLKNSTSSESKFWPFLLWGGNIFLKICFVFAGNAAFQAGYDSVEECLAHMRRHLSLWQERFQLIVLISLGEIVAAAAKAKDEADESSWGLDPVNLCAMFTAIGCYFLYFSCIPSGWTPPGLLSYNGFTLEALGTVFITAALAAMGAGFGRLMEAQAQAAHGHRRTTLLKSGLTEGNVRGHPDAQHAGETFSASSEYDRTSNVPDSGMKQTFVLLCGASGAFLVASSVVSALGFGNPEAGYRSTKISGRGRACCRVVIGFGLGSLPHFGSVAVSFSPESMALLVAGAVWTLVVLELWACGPRASSARVVL